MRPRLSVGYTVLFGYAAAQPCSSAARGVSVRFAHASLGAASARVYHFLSNLDSLSDSLLDSLSDSLLDLHTTRIHHALLPGHPDTHPNPTLTPSPL